MEINFQRGIKGELKGPILCLTGHAHAGVIVILSLVCQMLADAAVFPAPLLWFVRIGVPVSAILVSPGFFLSVLPPTATQANGAVSLIYVGALILAIDAGACLPSYGLQGFRLG